MSIFKDDTIAFNNTAQQFINSTMNTFYTNLYRMRTALDGAALPHTAIHLKLSNQVNKLNINHAFYFRLSTKAIPRTDEEDYSNILDCVNYELEILLSKNNPNRYGLIIINTNACPKNTDAAIKAIQDASSNAYTEIDMRHALTLTPFHETHVLKYAEQNLAIIFTNTLSDTFLLHVGAILPIIYGVPVIESVANALLAEDKTAYATALEAPLVEVEKAMRKERLRTNLTEAMTRLNKNIITDVTSQIESCNADIKYTLENYSNYLKEKQELEERLLGLQTKGTNEANTAFIEYIFNNKADAIIDANIKPENKLELVIKTPLLYFNKSHFEYYTTSTRSNCYTDAPAVIQQLLKDLFLNDAYTIMFINAVLIDFKRFTISQSSNSNYNLDYAKEGMPNPHMYRFNCWGNNEPLIRQCLKDKSYIVAIEQICGAVAGLNISDSAVFKYFVSYIQYSHIKELPILQNNTTKEWITINQYIKNYQEGLNHATN